MDEDTTGYQPNFCAMGQDYKDSKIDMDDHNIP